jgi:hypothetical protein
MASVLEAQAVGSRYMPANFPPKLPIGALADETMNTPGNTTLRLRV